MLGFPEHKTWQHAGARCRLLLHFKAREKFDLVDSLRRALQVWWWNFSVQFYLRHLHVWWESAAGVSDTIFADAFSYSSCELVVKEYSHWLQSKGQPPAGWWWWWWRWWWWWWWWWSQQIIHTDCNKDWLPLTDSHMASSGRLPLAPPLRQDAFRSVTE